MGDIRGHSSSIGIFKGYNQMDSEIGQESPRRVAAETKSCRRANTVAQVGEWGSPVTAC